MLWLWEVELQRDVRHRPEGVAAGAAGRGGVLHLALVAARISHEKVESEGLILLCEGVCVSVSVSV